ncbi:MAG: protein kinase domain-containing protein [Pyrinomonadaceae bacterium]
MYEAYDTVNKSKVVLKETLATSGKVVTTSQREASDLAFSNSATVLTKFKHEALVGVKDYFSEVERQYLVLEPLSEFDLTRFLQPDTSRPKIELVLRWTEQLLDAMNYLHKLSPPVIHGDIRPENIRFTSDDELKLLTAEIETIPGTDSNRKTADRVDEAAAIHYQPLEQFWSQLDSVSQRSLLRNYDEAAERMLKQAPDARSDIYSLGACLYHVLTGIPPIDALDRSTALSEGKPDPLKNPCEIDGTLTVEVSNMVMKAMEVRRELRFYSAAVMIQVVKTVKALIVEQSAEVSDGPLLNQKKEDSIESRLELERSKTKARQLELEAEQAHLEEEQKRIEERRLALETEKQNQLAEVKRLELEAENARKHVEQERRLQEKRRLEAEAEQECERAAQHLAEIEASEEARRAEAERLGREAEEAHKQAEERLLQFQAEQEHHRTEQQAVAEKVKDELRRAEMRLKELSNHDALDEVNSESAVLARDQKTVESDVIATPTNYSTTTDLPSLMFEVDQKRSSMGIKTPLIGVGVGLMLLLGVGLWFSANSVSSPDPAVQSTQMSLSAQAANSETVTVPPPAEQSTFETQAAAAQPSPSGESSANTSIGPIETSLAPSDAAVQNDRLKQNPPAKKPNSAKPTAPKKKVTADDLINDN